MSASSWPGLSEGGTLWFPDLTQPALDIANLAAPLGSAGIILPLAVSAAMFANVSLAFGPLSGPAARTGQFVKKHRQYPKPYSSSMIVRNLTLQAFVENLTDCAVIYHYNPSTTAIH